MTYDIAVIGGGPAGYNAAEYAAGKGKKVVLFEKGNHLGGVCLNEGCIPTKAMLHSAHLLEKISNADKYGITVDGNVSADYGKIMTLAVHPAYRGRRLAAGRLRAATELLQAAGLPRICGETRLSNEAMRRTFAACGYRLTRIEEAYYDHPPESACKYERQVET